MGQKTEIIDLLNPNYSINSKLPEVPPRYGAVGGVIQNHVIVCGGEHDFSNNFRDGVVVGLPNKIHMVEKRFDASSIGKISLFLVYNSQMSIVVTFQICFVWITVSTNITFKSLFII